MPRHALALAFAVTLAVVSAVASTVAIAPLAHAQDGRAVLAVAAEALAEGDAGRALELARMARAIDPEAAPEALVLMGRALLRLERPIPAQRLFARALESGDPRVRRAATDGITRAHAHTGVLRLRVHPHDARVTLDEAPVEWERGQGTVLASAGWHRVEARAPGHTTRRTNVYVGADRPAEVHLLLTPGREDEVQGVRRRDDTDHTTPWLEGHLIQTGAGLAGAGAAAAWARDAATRATPGAIGAQRELALAHYELGVSLGLAVVSQLQLPLLESTRGHAIVPLELGAAMLMVGGAFGVALTTPGLGASEQRFTSGFLLGGAASALGSLGLQRGGDLRLGLLITSVALALGQLPVALEALTYPAPSAQELEALPTAGADPCAQPGLAGRLASVCERRESSDRAQMVTIGAFLGSTALALGAGVALAIGDPGDARDVSFAAGPSGLRLSGRF